MAGRRGFFATTLRLVGAAVLLVVTAVLALQVYFFASIAWWVFFDPSSTSFMRTQQAELRKTRPRAELNYRWADYRAISSHLKRAVITAEDGRFVDHEGVDWDAIGKAWENNQKKGRRVKGGSTITQQLAKNLFLSGERSYLRKGQELIITYMLEALMSKQRILELYLNVAEWGVGVFGAEAAARHYFGVSAAQLSPYQAARLAAMLPRPRFFDRNRGSAYLAQRTNAIQRYMMGAELP